MRPETLELCRLLKWADAEAIKSPDDRKRGSALRRKVAETHKLRRKAIRDYRAFLISGLRGLFEEASLK